MKGYINKIDIINSYNQKTDLHKFDAIAEIISEILEDDQNTMTQGDYYHTIYSIWNIIENNEA